VHDPSVSPIPEPSSPALRHSLTGRERVQIAGTPEVKAQVKLRFINNQKEKMLVERRLQVTRKKTGGGLTMKTLEGTISFVDSDRKQKGVSKANPFPRLTKSR